MSGARLLFLNEDWSEEAGVWACHYLSQYKVESEDKEDLVVLTTKRLP